MADEGVLVEALAPVGPDDEQVDDEDGEPGAEPSPPGCAAAPPRPEPLASDRGVGARAAGRAYLLAKYSALSCVNCVHSDGELVLGEAGVDRAGLDAGIAVDALVGIDEELLCAS